MIFRTKYFIEVTQPLKIEFCTTHFTPIMSPRRGGPYVYWGMCKENEYLEQYDYFKRLRMVRTRAEK